MLNRDFLTGATVALALHALLLFWVRAQFHARPLPVREESFVVSLVEVDSPATRTPAPAPEPNLPPRPAPPEPTLPPPVIPPPDPQPSAPTSVISTSAPSAPPRPAAAPRPPTRPRTVRRVDGTPVAAASVIGGGVSSDARPRYRSNPPPEYPADARRLKQEGRVLLDVEVSAEGRPLSVSLKRSSGVPSLDETARRAVRRWSFEPARRAGVAIAAQVEVPVQFTLAR